MLVLPEWVHQENFVITFPDMSDDLRDQGDQGKNMEEETEPVVSQSILYPLKRRLSSESCLLR